MQPIVIQTAGRDILGEGPVWDATRNALLWVDIVGRRVHRLQLETGRHLTLDVDEPVGWVLPRQNGPELVAGFKSGFAFLDVETGAVRAIGNPEPDRPGNRLNDAKVDAWGNIWAGSKDDSDKAATGALYRLDGTLAWSRVDDGYSVTNGPAFSLDGHTMFHTDSAARTVFAFDITAEGKVSGKREWLRFNPEWGYPDGMTTDAEDCLWIAHWAGSRLSRFSPDGRLVQSFNFPASNITSCTFAGPDLDRMFVTSSSLGTGSEDLGGSLFEIDPGVKGCPQTQFSG